MQLNHSLCALALSAAVAVLPALARQNVAQETLKNAAANASVISNTAQKLYMEAPNDNLSWQGEALRLEQLKDSVDQIADQIAHLDLWKNMETPPERKAVTESNPLLKDMAAQTTDAIRFLNANAHGLFEPEYREHIEKIKSDAERMHTLFQDSTKLQSISRQASHLRKELNHT